MQISQSKDMPACVLTNHSVDQSLQYLKKHRGFGGKLAAPAGRGSLARHVRAATNAHKALPAAKAGVSRAFEILDDVRSGDYTKWHIVYDLKAGVVHFRSLGNWNIKTVRLDAFDSDCSQPARFIDLNRQQGGDVSAAFQQIDLAANQTLVTHSTKHIKEHLPAKALEAVARFPLSFTCAPSANRKVSQ